MKVVILSDLCWEAHLRSVTLSEVAKVDLERINITRYHSIQKYLSIIIKEKAEIVVFAGDVTGDGSCGHGFHRAFMMLLSMLEKLKIHSCFISGNHDEQIYYEQVVTFAKGLEYCQEISNRSVVINGMKMLGVPYETTYSKSKIKNLLSTYTEEYDLVVAHSQLKRRIRLFDLNTKMIVTGHYDRKLFAFMGSTFVALDNDDSEISYATIDWTEDKWTTSINVINKDNIHFCFSEDGEKINTMGRSHTLSVDRVQSVDLRMMEMYADDRLVDDKGNNVGYMKYLRGVQYLKLLDRLMTVKADENLRPTLAVTENIVEMQITENYKVSESLIIDYLGKRSRKIK